jgi:hypothetical protein
VGETFGIQVNPAGLENRLSLTWKWKLSDSKSPLLSESNVTVGVNDILSPAFNRVGAWVAVAPLSILELKAGDEPVAYFGTFSHLLGFRSYDDDFSDDVRKARKDEAEGALGVRWYVAPTFQIKLGRVAAVSHAEVEWWRVDAPGNVFYEPSRGTLLDSDGDRAVTVSSLLLYEIPGTAGRKTLAGVSHDLVDVPKAPQNRRQRVGLVGMRVFGERRFGVKQPTLYASVLYNFEDPVREGGVSVVVAAIFGLGH